MLVARSSKIPCRRWSTRRSRCSRRRPGRPRSTRCDIQSRAALRAGGWCRRRRRDLCRWAWRPWSLNRRRTPGWRLPWARGVMRPTTRDCRKRSARAARRSARECAVPSDGISFDLLYERAMGRGSRCAERGSCCGTCRRLESVGNARSSTPTRVQRRSTTSQRRIRPAFTRSMCCG